MIYPPDFEQKIGFDQIREILKSYCFSELGKEEVNKISCSAIHHDVEQSLLETEDFRQILLSGVNFPSQDYYNTIPLLRNLRIENTYPEPEQLSELGMAIVTFLDIIRFFNEERREAYPRLWLLVKRNTNYELRSANSSAKLEVRSTNAGSKSKVRSAKGTDSVPRFPNPGSLIPDPVSHIAELINSVLDDKSQVRTSASKELSRIRNAINRLEGSVEKRMTQIFHEVRKSGWVDEGAEVTVREGRLVIPFRSAHKRRIQGVVHDESATGQTVFIEPVELFEMNNEIREYHYAERREIVRILTDVANRIRPHIEELMEMNHLLGMIDFIRAKARFAIDLGANMCSRLESRPHMKWVQAVHPLLYLSHKKLKKSVVPLDILLTKEHRVLVISGPNAGGKSICLKTAGLLQYMLQCGILPPAKEDSEFGIFRQIMIDIGDEQSLENDLSTYTSKLMNMKYFLEHVDPNSLFLIDEMGTGTDPSVGGAIAEATLVSLAGSGAYGVVTTHYSNLKLLAEAPVAESPEGDLLPLLHGKGRGGANDTTVIQNGAMLFDTRSMKPTYLLKQGKPGSSFAIEIATSVGFPEGELMRASELIGGSQLDFERQLQDLELEKEDVTRRSDQLHVADEFLDELITKYQGLVDELEQSKKTILENARLEAEQLLKDANKLIEKTIKEIRESQADRERTKKARSALAVARTGIQDPGSGMTTPVPDKGNRQPGTKTEKPASVIGGNATEVKQQRPGSSEKPAKSSFTEIIASKQESFTLILDLRGKRADEAFIELQRFMDDAILLSVNEVRILHGKGTGALREVTRNYLKGVKEVKRFHDETLERGGSGITVVLL